MTNRPDPMVPEDCALRGCDWMPLLGHRLFASEWYRLARRKDPRGAIAAIKLWWVAFLQQPAASLPADEAELCFLADFGEDMRTWNKHRAAAMHGFVLCNDGRWYHPVLAEEALRTWAIKAKTREAQDKANDRVRDWRERRRKRAEWLASSGASETPPETVGETPTETRFTTPETPSETRCETVHTDRHTDRQYTKEEKSSDALTTETREATPQAPEIAEGDAENQALVATAAAREVRGAANALSMHTRRSRPEAAAAQAVATAAAKAMGRPKDRRPLTAEQLAAIRGRLH